MRRNFDVYSECIYRIQILVLTWRFGHGGLSGIVVQYLDTYLDTFMHDVGVDVMP